MAFAEIFRLLRGLESDRIVERFAVGGAVGATFYLEPTATVDLDVFVVFGPNASRLILSLEPIYEYLGARGAKVEGEHLLIGDWPVQFLPAATPLLEDAMREAVDFEVDGEATRVFTAEHLAAIALELGRTKDKVRLLQFLEMNALDRPRFDAIIMRHGLTEKWNQFILQFPEAIL